jgi:hypothetical protein
MLAVGSRTHVAAVVARPSVIAVLGNGTFLYAGIGLEVVRPLLFTFCTLGGQKPRHPVGDKMLAVIRKHKTIVIHYFFGPVSKIGRQKQVIFPFILFIRSDRLVIFGSRLLSV